MIPRVEELRAEARRVDDPLAAFAEASRVLNEGDLDEAETLLDRLDYDALPPEEALSARIEAIQLAIFQERYDDALTHTEAALRIAADEPLIHHLAGRALWERGDQRGAAESFIHAAELLLEEATGSFHAQRMLDPSHVYFMAAEACRAFDQRALALDFYQQAARHALH